MAAERLIEQGFGITTIDTGFKRRGLVASHLVIENGQAAFIDVGVSPNVELLLATLDHYRIEPEQVAYVIVTHVHLDHAGAAGALMQHLPAARLVVHPRGARHMIDPSKLIAGATAVYGEEVMRSSFGEIVPIAEERVIVAEDGLSLDLNGRSLLCVDTPGHARHHICIVDEQSRGIFTGDTFGLSYRELDSAAGPFIFPTTTPVQFDPEALHASIERLLQFGPERIFLTHFGCVENPRALAAALHLHIDRFVEMVESVREGVAGQQGPQQGQQHSQQLAEMLRRYLLESLRQHGCELKEEEIVALMAMDIELNAQGLAYWLEAG